ncbi:S41 family peptidase [Undibacterium sp.]|uniref:S41 family peptidase n=1 Tax=Undibacterium sp. TaxID=1914977 RepID=UPI00273154A5|nr:S41 family peptidase [Undibacterium sp.]MDP1979194.1 S41 family peptidase [Undibacterium sp.]
MLSFKQSSKNLFALSAVSLILTACGGGSNQDARQAAVSPAPPMQAAPASDDVMSFVNKRQNYIISRLGSTYVVVDMSGGAAPASVPANIKVLQFADFRVNLTIGDKAKLLSTTALNNLIDLYVAFFNRVPDADGLSYWIDQVTAGMTEAQIAESFYLVALQSPALTGYTSSMSNDDFIRIIYKNVLGRTGSTAPNAAEIDYWSSQLRNGVPKGSMVRAILVSAREYANDATWGWVTSLLNNKLDVANYFAVQQGLSYLTLNDNISKTVALASAVTSTSTSQALDLIGVSGNTLNQNTSGSNGNNSNYGTPASLANICTPNGEKDWVRAHLDDIYLWYRDIINVPKESYFNPQDYFQALIVKSKDRFSFTDTQGSIDDYFQTGADVSFGFSLTRDSGGIRVRYVQPGSPADQAQIKRGATLVSVDNSTIGTYLNDTQYNAVYPSKAETHSFQIRDSGSFSNRAVTMTATTVTTAPVLQNQVLNVNGKKIGYMVFTDHIRTAEAPLVKTITEFKQAGVSELVLDLRYNGGGYLYIANELSAMIAGSKVTDKIFEKLQFNDKHTDLTADNISYFYDTDSNNRPLPQLNLSRVFVLTGSNTCSASESIINGLKPFMQVILIGDTTCGKPYGFIQTNNCKTAYFAIQFAGVNALNQGDFTNGFTPTCQVSDSLNYQLGDQSEPRLSAALKYVSTGSCPAAGFNPAPPPAAFDPVKDREPRPWRNNKLLKVNAEFR